jgi:hypothetical protein
LVNFEVFLPNFFLILPQECEKTTETLNQLSFFGEIGLKGLIPK